MKNWVKGLIFFLACQTHLIGYSVVAKPGILEAAQPDGTTVNITLHGNEFNHYALSEDGYFLTTDAEGYYVFADYNESGDVIPSRIRQINLSARTPDIAAAISEFEINRKKYSLANPKSETNKKRGPGLMPTVFPSKGSNKSLVVLVEFQNKKFTIQDPKNFYDRMLNKEGFDEYDATGSARDYFVSNSMGQFTPQFDVYGPITVPHDYGYYGENYGGFDGNPAQLAIDVCNLLDDEVNFSEYDCNNDGYIDNVYIFYAGYGEADGGEPATIWPHSWEVIGSGSGTHWYDGVKLNHYACSNELQYKDKKPDGIGTFCHEFCHVLGLPDLYNTGNDKTAYTPGSWEVLDTGCYNNNSRTPSAMSSFARYALDWMMPTPLSGGEKVLKPLFESNEAFIVNTNNPNEYFLLENRQKSGFDAGLPGHGMLVWHIDYTYSHWASNGVNKDGNHQRVDLLEADNIRKSDTRAGDSFPGTSSITELNSETTPGLVSWSGEKLAPAISGIVETTDRLITFTVTGIAPPEEKHVGYSMAAEVEEKLSFWGDGKSQNYDVAVAIAGDDFKDKKIKRIYAYINGECNPEEASLWIAENLTTESNTGHASPDMVNTAEVSEVEFGGKKCRKLEYEFEDPYELDGNKLYVGYSIKLPDDASRKDEKPVMIYEGSKQDGFYYHYDYGNWLNYTGIVNGVANIVVELVGDFPESALALDDIESRTVIVGEKFKLKADVTNTSGVEISTIGYTYTLDGSQYASTITLPTSLKPNWGVSLPVEFEFEPVTSKGSKNIEVTVTELNGLKNTESYSRTKQTSTLNAMHFIPVNRPLYEEVTGLWCIYCPRGFVGLEKMAEEYGDDVVLISYHYDDALEVSKAKPFNFAGYPSGILNRGQVLDPYYGSSNTNLGILQDIAVAGSSLPQMEINITDAKLNSNIVNFTVETRFLESLTGADFKIGYVLTADGLEGYAQSNAFSGQSYYKNTPLEYFVNQGSKVYGLIFNDVAVNVEGISGKSGIIPSDIKDNEIYAANFSIDISNISIIQHTDKLKINVFLIDNSTGKVLNANKRRVEVLKYDDIETGMSEIESESISIEWYDIAGRRVINPGKGLFIRKTVLSNGSVKTEKLMKNK